MSNPPTSFPPMHPTPPGRTGDIPQGRSAYERLLEELRQGRIGPGDRLREAELAERFGLSRTPIREALRQLEMDGLVVHLPRVGAAVRRLDYAEVMELYEMRAVLEGTAARLGTRAASQIEITELDTLNAEMVAAEGDAARVARLNRQFHLTLLDAARNRFLVKSMAAISRTLIILGPSTLTETERISEAAAEHARLVDAIRARDADAAEQAMRAHIERAHLYRLRQLRHTDHPVPED